jgi:hypothetical protein
VRGRQSRSASRNATSSPAREGLAKGEPGGIACSAQALPPSIPVGAFGEVLHRATGDVSEPASSSRSKVHITPRFGRASGRVSMRFLAARNRRPIRSGWWHRRRRMSPTVFRDGPFWCFFFSREEERLHIHVQSPDGEAKFCDRAADRARAEL